MILQPAALSEIAVKLKLKALPLLKLNLGKLSVNLCK